MKPRHVLGFFLDCRTPAKSLLSDKDKIVAYFTSEKEPKVKDALWTSDSMFKVAVIDDGTPRDGFAEYVCLTLKTDFGISGVRVKVIDVVKLVSKNDWVDLGEATCP